MRAPPSLINNIHTDIPSLSISECSSGWYGHGKLKAHTGQSTGIINDMKVMLGEEKNEEGEESVVLLF